MEVIDEKGISYKFKVVDKKTFDFDKFPLQEIFADTSGKKLNLVTCDGTFDQETKNYSKRTVIYTEMI